MNTKANLIPKKTDKRRIDSLLSFIKALNGDQDLKTFADNCDTTIGNLMQIAYGGSVSAKLSKKIFEKSNGEVPLEDLRPDIFS